MASLQPTLQALCRQKKSVENKTKLWLKQFNRDFLSFCSDFESCPVTSLSILSASSVPDKRSSFRTDFVDLTTGIYDSNQGPTDTKALLIWRYRSGWFEKKISLRNPIISGVERELKIHRSLQSPQVRDNEEFHRRCSFENLRRCLPCTFQSQRSLYVRLYPAKHCPVSNL